jgi:excisionase family DNA binding protein
MAEIDTLLTTRQLQALLQVDRITIYRMLNDGRLQGFKVGGQWRFSRQAIQRWLQEQQATLGIFQGPARAADEQPSPEALPLSCIQAIQDIFAEAMGVGTVTTAVDGRPLTPVANSCVFCNLILDTTVGRQRCIASWRAAASERGGLPGLVTCHAGLRYVWGRIEVQGQLVAATHAGQFLESPPDRESWSVTIEGLSSATGADGEQLQQALASVRVLDEERRHQVPQLLYRVARTFSEIGQERLSLLGRLRRIAEISSV